MSLNKFRCLRSALRAISKICGGTCAGAQSKRDCGASRRKLRLTAEGATDFSVLDSDSNRVQIHSDRLVAAASSLVILGLLCSALYASLYARGLYQDGAYYLFRVAKAEWFSLYQPARTTIDILRQAPIVFLSVFTDLSLFARAQVFSLTMLALPLLFVAVCWFLIPRGSKAWMLFPVMHLLIGYSTMSLEAVGEAAIATSYLWVLIFMLLFGTRTTFSQVLFVALFVPAVLLHEGALLCVPVLLLACALRASEPDGARHRMFLRTAVLLCVAMAAYQARWIIIPRIPAHREAALQAIFGLKFLVTDGRWNLPFVSGAVALLAMAATIALYLRKPKDAAERSAWAMALLFAAFALAAMIIALRVDTSLSPGSMAYARYNPIFATVLLGSMAVLAWKSRVSPNLLATGPTVAILVLLAAAQITADIVATRRWSAYLADLETRLQTSAGVITWESALHTGDPQRDRTWAIMSAGWTLPMLSIIVARDGVVKAIIDFPSNQPLTFRPVRIRQLAALPDLKGINYEPYRLAVEKQGEVESASEVPPRPPSHWPNHGIWRVIRAVALLLGVTPQSFPQLFEPFNTTKPNA